MSHKIDKDQEVTISHVEKLAANSVQFAELVFGHGDARLEWSDIRNASYVCKSWTKFVGGPYKLSKSYRVKFYSVFNGQDEKIVSFHEKRAEEDNAESVRCLLLVLEGQMLLVYIYLLVLFFANILERISRIQKSSCFG
jgi:hypothetical protein